MSRVIPPIGGLHIGGLHIGGGKIVGYLLDPLHERGGSKAAVLMRFGFSADQPTLLDDAIARHFTEAPDAWALSDATGAVRIVCVSPLAGSDGRQPAIRTVWLVEPNAYARLLTLIPRPRWKPSLT